MGRTKRQVFTELEVLLETHNIQDVLILLSNYMSTDELERFLEFVKDEYQ